MFESEDDRIAMIKAVGGEEFDAGRPETLWGIFDREFVEGSFNLVPSENRKPLITCRSSDVEAHGLVKQSVIKRVADGKSYVVKRLEPDVLDGSGMTVIILGA